MGLSAIREQWSGLIAMNGHMTVRSRYAIATGDLAVLSNEWTFEVDGERMSSVTAEVARRQPDGWLYVVDHPFAGSEPKTGGDRGRDGRHRRLSPARHSACLEEGDDGQDAAMGVVG